MPWVVDSCLLLDVALKDPEWGISSAELLETKRAEGLAVSPVSVVEITPQFGGDLREVRKFLAILGASDHEGWSSSDTAAACAAWSSYVLAKRRGAMGKPVVKRPIADILIGAFACRFTGLLTRNREDFRPWFPELRIEPRPGK